MSNKHRMRNAISDEAGSDVAALAVAVPVRTAADEVAVLKAQLAALEDAENSAREAAREKIRVRAQPFVDERNTCKGRIEADSQRVVVLTDELINMGWEEPRVRAEKVGWNLAKATVVAIAKRAQRGLPEFAKDPADWEASGGGPDNPLPPEWLNRVLRGLANKLSIATPEPAIPEAS